MSGNLGFDCEGSFLCEVGECIEEDGAARRKSWPANVFICRYYVDLARATWVFPILVRIEGADAGLYHPTIDDMRADDWEYIGHDVAGFHPPSPYANKSDMKV